MKLRIITAMLLASLTTQELWASDESVPIGHILTSFDHGSNCDLFQGNQRSSFRIPSATGEVEIAFDLKTNEEEGFVTDSIPSKPSEFVAHWIGNYGPHFKKTPELKAAEATVDVLELQNKVYPPKEYSASDRQAVQMVIAAQRAQELAGRRFLAGELQAVNSGAFERVFRYRIESQRADTRLFTISIVATSHDDEGRGLKRPASAGAEGDEARASKKSRRDDSQDRDREAEVRDDEDEEDEEYVDVVSLNPEALALQGLFTVEDADEAFADSKHMNQFEDMEEFLQFVIELMARSITTWVEKAKHSNLRGSKVDSSLFS